MIKFLRNLFKCCDHQFELIDKYEVTTGKGDDKRTVEIVYVSQCKKCGTLKETRI